MPRWKPLPVKNKGKAETPEPKEEATQPEQASAKQNADVPAPERQKHNNESRPRKYAATLSLREVWLGCTPLRLSTSKKKKKTKKTCKKYTGLRQQKP